MRFFSFVYKNFGYFFWIEFAYTIAVYIICFLLNTPEWVSAVFMLPLNLISWPVFFAAAESSWKLRNEPYRPLGGKTSPVSFAFLFAVLSVMMPLLALSGHM